MILERKLVTVQMAGLEKMVELVDKGTDVLVGRFVADLADPDVPRLPFFSPDLRASANCGLVGMPSSGWIDGQINATNEISEPGPVCRDILPGSDEPPIGLRLVFPGNYKEGAQAYSIGRQLGD